MIGQIWSSAHSALRSSDIGSNEQQSQSPTSGRPGVVIIGGGFAAVEMALAIRMVEGGDQRPVTVVSPRTSLSAGADLLYGPFGVYPPVISVREILATYGVTWIGARGVEVRADDQQLELDSGRHLEYDDLVLATGAQITPSPTRMRTWSDAQRIEKFVRTLPTSSRVTMLFRLVGEHTWPMPLIEFAFLLDAYRRRRDITSSCEIVIATEESQLLPRFTPEVEDVVVELLRSRGVEIITQVPAGRCDQLEGDLVIDAGPLTGNALPGIPATGPSGFVETDDAGRIDDHLFAIGDITSATYRTAGIVSAQARRVAGAITSQIGDDDPRFREVQMHVDGRTLTMTLDTDTPFDRNAPVRADIAWSDVPVNHYAGTLVSQLGIVDSRSLAHRFAEDR